MRNDEVRLVADIGGTNARFALFHPDQSIHSLRVLACADYPDIVAAVQAYMAMIGVSNIKEAAFAIANPIDGDRIEMTNHNWAFSIGATRRALGLSRLTFKNDFTALAMSIPSLVESELRQIGGEPRTERRALAVLGPGTGLGVSGLIRDGDNWVTLEGEGGHVSVSPANPRECDILQVCWAKYSHVSAERLVSGMGLQNLYQAICTLENIEAKDFSPADITMLGQHAENRQCEEALSVFCGLLGSVAGNLVLTLGAFDGVYIGGGIVPRLGDYFDQSTFRERFEAKGRFSKHLIKVPAYVIQADNPALVGIGRAFALSA
jgi:glucokinase